MGEKNSNDNKNKCSGCEKLAWILDKYGVGNVGINIKFVTGTEFPSSELAHVCLDKCTLSIFDDIQKWGKKKCSNKRGLHVITCDLIKYVQVFASDGLNAKVFTIRF